ncbi:MAG: CBS domain-containing protein [Pirellulales bacterium]
MRLRDILSDKGSAVHTVGLQDSLGTVVDRMVDRRCGSLVVVEGEQVVGIITERDILRVSAARLGSLDGLQVADHLSRDLVVGHPDDLISDVMGVLTHRRVRHLPVLESGRLVGIISIGDVVKAQHDALSIENHYLRTYLAG